MPQIATSTFKKLFMKRQTGLGVVASAGPAGSARGVRRVTSTINLQKANYGSAEVNESQQVRDNRHGVISANGSLNGELSVGGYQQPFESLLRQNSQAPGATAANATIVTASTGDRTGTFTRTGGSFLADGHKIGDVIRPSGFTTTAIGNNNRNMVITALTATVMTVYTMQKGAQILPKAAGDSVAIAAPGRKTWTPQTGHTRDYYTLEHWFADIGRSEVYRDVVVTGANIALPPSGLATVEFPLMALDDEDTAPGNVQYFTSPAASPVGPTTAAVNGVLLAKGVPIGLVTGLTINVTGNYAYADPNGHVGEDTHVDISPGVFTVTGQMTVLFTDDAMRQIFLTEEEISLVAALTGTKAVNSEFVAFNMSRLKVNGADKDDTATGIAQTVPFQALENVNGGAALANLQTTLSIQDSLWVA